MNFSDLMKEVEIMFNSWVNDSQLREYIFNNDKEAMQKEFINCIQQKIGSDFVLLSKEEFFNLH